MLRKEEEFERVKKLNRQRIEAETSTQLPPAPPDRKFAAAVDEEAAKPAFTVGEHVKVEADTSAGMNRPEGCGWVVQVRGCDTATITDVKHEELHGGNLHKNMPFAAITPAPCYQGVWRMECDKSNKRSSTRDKTTTKKCEPSVAPKKADALTELRKDLPPSDKLALRLREKHWGNAKRGWRRQEMTENGIADQPKKHSKAAVPRMNEKEISQLLTEVALLKQCLSQPGNDSHCTGKSKKSGKHKKRKSKHNPVSAKCLVQHAWGLSNSYLADLEKKRKFIKDNEQLLFVCADHKSEEAEGKKMGGKVRSVIDCHELAERLCTAQCLHAVNKCRHQAKDNLDCVNRKEHNNCFQSARKECDGLSDEMKLKWEAKRRSHLMRQSGIKEEIVHALKQNPHSSWRHIEKLIGHWCCDATIRRWLTSLDGCQTCNERIMPLLSKQQQKKHSEFAKHYRNNWGLGPGKYLLINHDEKWFGGMVMRRDAKMCQELGIDPVAFSACHKSHISKVMAVTVAAFAFVDSMENGGEAIKLGNYRAQSYEIAQKKVCAYETLPDGTRQKIREQEVQPDGSIKLVEKIVRNKGDPFLVDCAVAGSKEGTPDDPKFALKTLFKSKIFPEVDDLVKVGGRFEGHVPIFQGDNAGPHEEENYLKFVTEHCAAKGWHWEPQAPQMPHMNNLDLSVFPNMSRRHTNEARARGGLHCLKENEIWETTVSVWNSLPNSHIAKGCIQAHRIAQKVIAAGGSNSFLGPKREGIRCGVTKDFSETANGLKCKDGEHISGPPRTRP